MKDERVVIVARHVESCVQQLAAVELASIQRLLDDKDVECATEAKCHQSIASYDDNQQTDGKRTTAASAAAGSYVAQTHPIAPAAAGPHGCLGTAQSQPLALALPLLAPLRSLGIKTASLHPLLRSVAAALALAPRVASLPVAACETRPPRPHACFGPAPSSSSPSRSSTLFQRQKNGLDVSGKLRPTELKPGHGWIRTRAIPSLSREMLTVSRLNEHKRPMKMHLYK